MRFQNHRAEGREKPAARCAPRGRETFDIIGKRHIRERKEIRKNQLESNVSFYNFDKLETRKSIKSVRGMPRLSEAKKDVTSCDKRGGGANSP